jgi:hypothetical protein
VVNRRADHATPHYPQKLTLPSPTRGIRSVGIVRLRTKGHGVFFLYVCVSVLVIIPVSNKFGSEMKRNVADDKSKISRGTFWGTMPIPDLGISFPFVLVVISFMRPLLRK